MTETAVAEKKAVPPIVQYLEKYKSQIAQALPKHMTADRMARIVLTEVRKVPKLLECDPRSLFGAVIQASQVGLEPGSALGHAYLLPFYNTKKKTSEVQLLIGYRGMLDLARRSGQIRSIVARPVYDGDQFEYAFGLNEVLEHRPAVPRKQKAELTYVYAVAHLIGGGTQFEVMSRDEVDAIRAKSLAGDSGPWATHFEEMAKKTAIRRIFKYLPVSVEVQRAVGLDELADAGLDQKNSSLLEGEFTDVTEHEQKQGNDAVKERLAKKAGKPPFDEVAEQIKNATKVVELDAALQTIGHLTEKQQAELKAAADKKREFCD